MEVVLIWSTVLQVSEYGATARIQQMFNRIEMIHSKDDLKLYTIPENEC